MALDRTLSRDDQILCVLQQAGAWGATSSEIAQKVGAPEPSVRRSIQTLRREGHNISFAGDMGLYRMGA